MPYWTTQELSLERDISFQDSRNALISTLVPGGAAVAAFIAFSKDKEVTNWWSTVKKPEWAPRDVRLYSAVDLLTLSPLGYASYLVYKNGGGFDYNDTKLALALYGTNIVCALATIPIVKKKNLSCLWKNTLLVHLTALGAAIAFYKIEPTAGYFMAPYAVWTGFYTLLTYAIHKENQVVKDL